MNHLPDIIMKLGPPIEYSTRSLERMIGNYKSRIRSRTNPGSESSKQLVELAATNYRKLMGQQSNDDISADEFKMTGYINEMEARYTLSPETMDMIGANENDTIISAKNISIPGCIYHSSRTKNRSSRIDYMLVFKVKVQR
jgi:hypothetical protein